jgi:hypothetical protein
MKEKKNKKNSPNRDFHGIFRGSWVGGEGEGTPVGVKFDEAHMQKE